jgi:ABC-type multidrug transport system ATPase subunit
MNCVQTTNLIFRFSKDEIVLNDINLAVGEGTIYGFLGPNGAGKTTTLKLVLGLLQNQQGEISVFGKPFTENRIEILKKIGSLIESPSLYGHLTARDNPSCASKDLPMSKAKDRRSTHIGGLAEHWKQESPPVLAWHETETKHRHRPIAQPVPVDS